MNVDPRNGEFRSWCAHAHFGLEVDSPALKVIWVWEFSAPVRCIEFQGSRCLENRGVGIVELCGSRLNPCPCLMAIPSNDGDILDFQERFLKYTSSPCMVRQPRIAAKHGSGTRNSRGLTGNVGHSRSARCLRIEKNPSLHSRHSPCLAGS